MTPGCPKSHQCCCTTGLKINVHSSENQLSWSDSEASVLGTQLLHVDLNILPVLALIGLLPAAEYLHILSVLMK